MSSPDDVTVDWPGFVAFKNLNDRYKHLPPAINQVLTSNLEHNLSDVKILDLGCGDLTLNELLGGMSLRNASFMLVDNCQDVEAIVKVKLNSSVNWTTEAIFHFSEMFKFVGELTPSKFDVVICSHALYHLPRDKWTIFINRIFSALHPQGIALFVLRSLSGDWWKTFNPVFDQIGAERKKSHVFSEDFKEHLVRNEIIFSSEFVDFSLLIESESEFMRVAEFLYRLPEGFIMRNNTLRHELWGLVLSNMNSSGKFEIGFRDEIIWKLA